MASIQISKVRKSYGSQAVIHGIDIDIADREFIVILGPSGCGKSTLLRMIAGLERIDDGEISIAGRVVNELEPRERDVAMVFQNYALYPHMSVFDNVSYALKLSGKPRSAIAESVGALARSLGLTDLLARKPGQLSGGQRQRVALGRAIIRRPKVFLFDEPLSNLDATLRAQMRAELKRLHLSLEATSVMVTHDQIEAMTMASRIVVMNRGRVEQIGAPMEVYRYPQTDFVAGFIGSPQINLVDGVYDPSRGGVALDAGGFIPKPLATEASAKVRVGIRPEHLVPAPADTAWLTGKRDIVEELGSTSLVHVETASGFMAMVVPPDLPARLPSQIGLRARIEDVHVFAAEGGQRLAPATSGDAR